ncbi:CUB and sushi domain-containing protein 3-like [Penaeus chinensis]|uniref:CUB and sushi domain-containing protein 3-like n=1 Tax=Penaeus chinensis TaxID=139456 RepID=UPI001FB6C27F|nr:CUB and sushi domain-containing protein 3-like [Penaeus chinensis]
MKFHCFLLFLLGGALQLCGAAEYLSQKAESEIEADFYQDDIDSRDVDDDYDDYDLEEGEPDYFDDEDASEQPFGRFRRAAVPDTMSRLIRRHEKIRAHGCKLRGGFCVQPGEACDGERAQKFCAKYHGHCCFPAWDLPMPECPGREINITDGGVITDTEGMIMSRGYPNIYDRNSHDTMVINAPENYVIEIELKALDLEYDSFCNHDYLRIVDTATNRGLGWFNEPRICGDVIPPVLRSLTNSVTFEMVSDYNIQKGGFIACFRMVPRE